MPMIAKTTAQAVKSFDQRIVDKDYFAQLMERDRKKIEDEIIRRVQSILKPFLLRNRVIRCLTNPPVGMPGWDLPAEFGLNNSQAREAANYIIDVLLATVTSSTSAARARVAGLKNVSRFSPGCRYLEPSQYEAEILAMGYQGEQQFSKNPKKNAEIRNTYMKNYAARQNKKFKGSKTLPSSAINSYNINYGSWMINARSGIRSILTNLPGVEHYGITYDLFPHELRFSRSGRALMLDATKPRNIKRLSTFPYEFPEALKPWPGEKNFVTGIGSIQALREQAIAAVAGVVDRFSNVK